MADIRVADQRAVFSVTWRREKSTGKLNCLIDCLMKSVEFVLPEFYCCFDSIRWRPSGLAHTLANANANVITLPPPMHNKPQPRQRQGLERIHVRDHARQSTFVIVLKLDANLIIAINPADAILNRHQRIHQFTRAA